MFCDIILTNRVKGAIIFMAKFKTENLQQTEALGKRIAEKLTGNEVIAFFGDLGAGKTTITRSIVKALESDNDVSSPTFAIVNEYKGKFNIYHFDMYRISGWDDLYSTGFFDYLDNGILIIEWSENIENALPDKYIRICIEKGASDTERIFDVEGLEI